MFKFVRLFLMVMFVCSSFDVLLAADSVSQEIKDGYLREGVAEWVQEKTGGQAIRINRFEPGAGMDAINSTDLFRTPLLGLEKGGKSIRVEENAGARVDWFLGGTVHYEPSVHTACVVVLELKRGRGEKYEKEVVFDSPNIIAAITPVGQGTPIGREETIKKQSEMANCVAEGYVVSPTNGPISDSAVGESPAVSGEYKVQLVDSDGAPYELKEYRLKSQKDGATIGEIYQCDLREGLPFKLLIENNSDCDAAVEVFIDGVSAFALWEEPKPGFFIVRQGGSCEIPGWLTNASGKANGREFVAGRYKESVAKSLGVNPYWDEGRSEISFLFRRAGKNLQDLGPDDDAPGVVAGNVINKPVNLVEESVASEVHCKISVWYSVR